MKIYVQNLQKQNLVPTILEEHKPDVALFSEWVETPEAIYGEASHKYFVDVAKSFKKKDRSIGTAIYSKDPEAIEQTVLSPHADFRAQFWKGTIKKATAIATLANGLTVVSFHGYNGWPRHNVQKLIDHVRAVLDVIPTGPCVFAGDFNTFTNEHHSAVFNVMFEAGFSLRTSAPYDKKKVLDLVYARGCTTQLLKIGRNESDHPFLVFEVT